MWRWLLALVGAGLFLPGILSDHRWALRMGGAGFVLMVTAALAILESRRRKP